MQDLLKSAEMRALPKIELLIYGSLILLSPVFESGLTLLDLHRNVWAHLVFYLFLFGLIRELLIRRSPKLSIDDPEAPFIRILRLEQRFALITGIVALIALIYCHRTSFLFPIVTFLIAMTFYIHGAHSSKTLRLVAFLQLIIGSLSIVVLNGSGGIGWLPIFTTALSASFLGSALFR